MIHIRPVNQTKLFGLNKFINELIQLDKINKLPNKLLLSGQKGIGKSTLAYHFINYALSKNEDLKYDDVTLKINTENRTYKTILNQSNPNFFLIDINLENKTINIDQIRRLISYLSKSSLNDKPRFILIDNIEFLNFNSINALLKVLEEPSLNTNFILINNDKKVLPTLFSRCINFKISLTNKENLIIADQLFDGKLNELINSDLINYYLTAGNIYKLIKFGETYKYDLSKFTLKEFLIILIKNNHYKKDDFIQYLIFDLIEFYFSNINLSFSTKIYNKYIYFLNRISDTKKFNLDEESLFIEFKEKILNG